MTEFRASPLVSKDGRPITDIKPVCEFASEAGFKAAMAKLDEDGRRARVAWEAATGGAGYPQLPKRPDYEAFAVSALSVGLCAGVVWAGLHYVLR